MYDKRLKKGNLKEINKLTGITVSMKDIKQGAKISLLFLWIYHK